MTYNAPVMISTNAWLGFLSVSICSVKRADLDAKTAIQRLTYAAALALAESDEKTKE